MFKCEKCGWCCRSLSHYKLYSDLDRGDGICRYLDTESNLCKIYQNRPLKCNVDEMYKNYFSQKMNRVDYYKLNYEACRKLQTNKGDINSVFNDVV